MSDFIQNLVRKIFPASRKITEEDAVDDQLLYVTVKEYDRILVASLPYYNSLTEPEKQRFIKRLYRFHHAKQFHFIAMEAIPGPPVLISAAAIQITFGLKKFMLPYFKDIFIMPDAYHLKGADELYIGHVSPKGIYISWKHFIEGFAVPNDGINVAFHELAHAVHRENFEEETGVDWDFREDFAKMTYVFGPSLTQMIQEKQSYLRGYAFRSFYEFWAVSVEAFFEEPKGLSENMPNLYKILCEVLNQDPLKSPKVLGASG